jgi:hypothetical protein
MGWKVVDCVNSAKKGENGALSCSINAENGITWRNISLWKMTLFHEVSQSVG